MGDMNMMNKFWALLALGILVVALPFTGFPPEWRKAALVLAGLGIVVFTTLLMREVRSQHLSEPRDRDRSDEAD